MIIVSTQCFPPELGGIEMLMHTLCTALSNSGHVLRVYADGGNGPGARDFDLTQDFPILRFSGFKPRRRRKKARDIAQFLKDNPVHAVMTDSWKSLEYLDAGPAPRVVCLAHGMEFPLKTGGLKTRRIVNSLGKAGVIIANSAYTAGRIEKYTGPDNRIQVIHPGINPPAAADSETMARVAGIISRRSPVLISLARLEPRKGLERALKIMPALLKKYPRVLYIIAGEGSLRRELERTAGNLNLGEHVLFCGRLEEPFKSCYLQSSDVFLLPGAGAGNDIEGFGMAYVEAAAHGLTAVAGRSGGAMEAVVHQHTGIVCDAENEGELLTAVMSLLDNSELRRQLGENARKRSEQFLWQNRIKDYEKLLFPDI